MGKSKQRCRVCGLPSSVHFDGACPGSIFEPKSFDQTLVDELVAGAEERAEDWRRYADPRLAAKEEDEATAEWTRDLQGTATDLPPLEDDQTAEMLGLVARAKRENEERWGVE
jgi:hypothetical protein